MVDAVERRGQVGIERPHAAGPWALARVVDLRDRVLAAAARPKPIRSGLETGLPSGGPAGDGPAGGNGVPEAREGGGAPAWPGLMPGGYPRAAPGGAGGR